jgi:AcrR family transcriptional regulator
MDGRRRAQVTEADAGVRARILGTACRLFYDEGIQAVGVQRLIEEAGVAKASLYAHFPSKDDVVAAYLDEQASAWRDAVQRDVLDGDAAPRERVLRYFDLIARWMRDDAFRGCPFQHAASEMRDPLHPARAVAARHRAWLRDLLVGLLREAGAREPDRLARTLQLLIDGAAAAAAVDGAGGQAADARRAAELLLDAHLAPPSVRRRGVRRVAGR